jgi:HK97 family phage prohead protease
MGSYETKSFKCEYKTDDQPGHIIGHAAVFGNLDLVNDIIEDGAFKRSIDQRGPTRVMLWNHNPNDPIGKADVKEDEKGLYFDAWANMDVTRAKEIYSLIKQGALNGASIGYDPIVWDFDKDGVRHLKELRLWEISPVTFPANPEATVSAKSVVPYQDLPLDEERAWDAMAATNRVAEWAGGPDKDKIDWAKYRKAFLSCDPETADTYGGYKLAIADVVDGGLKAIWRGIVASAAVVQGARGGVDIPSDEMEGVKRHIARYYAKAEKDPPWAGKGFGIDYAVEAVIVSADSQKAGRVLSKVSKDALRQAVSILQDLLSRAEEDAEDPAKSHSPDPSPGKGPTPADDIGDPEIRSLKGLVDELLNEIGG